MLPPLPVVTAITLAIACFAPACKPSKWGQARDSLGIDVPAEFEADRTVDPAITAAWINDFDDKTLDRLVTEALEHNRDLQAAAARMRAADANARSTAASLFPQIDADAAARRFQRVLTQSSRLVGSGADAITSDRVNDYGINLNIGWEADLWGRIRNNTAASYNDAVAAAADYYAARLSLAANTARSWFNCLEAEAQVRLARSTLDNFESAYNIIDSSFQRGVADALDVRLAKANVAGAVSTLNVRLRELDAAKRSLETLLGRYPSGDIDSALELPAIKGNVPPGLPSELLRRRPDLIAAEGRAEAAIERVKGAKKELLPVIRLTAGGGLSSDELADLLTLERLIWNIAASAVQPIFQGGRIVANIDLQKARADENIAEYADAVLIAFQEVESALAAEAYLREQLVALGVAADESVKAETLALDEYERGLVDIVTVLEAQRRSFNSQESLLQSRNLILQNRIDLYLALGGDFDLSS
ncbi:MAG: TolC family protein [Verrucomicrobiota bacterium]